MVLSFVCIEFNECLQSCSFQLSFVCFFSLLLAMASRGGARHFAKPIVDVGLLLTQLTAHKSLVKDFGAYEAISRTGSVDFIGIMHNLDLKSL